MYKKITKCRICGNSNLAKIMDLGTMKLTGVFPLPDEEVEEGPLELTKCDGEGVCGLVQLVHSFEAEKMYGGGYGYRSGLNISMVNHLREITSEIRNRVEIKKEDLIIDIGSNDGTLLGTYIDAGVDCTFVGIDPTGEKFKKYYKEGIALEPQFFEADLIKKKYPSRKAKVITSIAMFYDLEDPVHFAKDIAEILEKDRIWVMEQSYLPLMIETNSYDTICHEHLEFYTLKQIEWIAEKAALKVIDVVTNDINGGSFRVILAKENAMFKVSEAVLKMRKSEEDNGYNTLEAFEGFHKAVLNHKEILIDFLKKCKQEGKVVLGYGASTKGNVVLQYCGITSELLPAIAEVNSDKYGHVTPGTNIPIISEEEAKGMNPDYFLALPWHFKDNILEKEAEYILHSGCKFVFYLPEFEIK